MFHQSCEIVLMSCPQLSVLAHVHELSMSRIQNAVRHRWMLSLQWQKSHKDMADIAINDTLNVFNSTSQDSCYWVLTSTNSSFMSFQHIPQADNDFNCIHQKDKIRFLEGILLGDISTVSSPIVHVSRMVCLILVWGKCCYTCSSQV